MKFSTGLIHSSALFKVQLNVFQMEIMFFWEKLGITIPFSKPNTNPQSFCLQNSVFFILLCCSILSLRAGLLILLKRGCIVLTVDHKCRVDFCSRDLFASRRMSLCEGPLFCCPVLGVPLPSLRQNSAFYHSNCPEGTLIMN